VSKSYKSRKRVYCPTCKTQLRPDSDWRKRHAINGKKILCPRKLWRKSGGFFAGGFNGWTGLIYMSLVLLFV